MKLENSETLQCLLKAFAGESEARNRYTFYSKVAKKEGYEQISAIFTDTAENEREHAKLFYKFIPEGKHKIIDGEYPFSLGNTLENLIAASEGEREEWEIIYKNSAQIAKEEGFEDIEKLFNGIIGIEKHHSHRFETLAEELKNGTLFSKAEQTQWICRKCGHIQISKCAPNKCPVCDHPQGYFEIFTEKF